VSFKTDIHMFYKLSIEGWSIYVHMFTTTKYL